METNRSGLLVWGAGGHGRVAADLVVACGHAFLGFVDASPPERAYSPDPGQEPLLLPEAELLATLRDRGRYPAGVAGMVLGIGDNRARAACLRLLGDHPLPGLVHPAATLSPTARVGRGTLVMAGAVINASAELGEAVIVNSGAIVEHDCVIGRCAHVSPGAVLSGGVRVGERSWIGAGATVIPGVAIGTDVIVGAGAVVLSDVADGTTVVGVPSRPIRRGAGRD